MQGLMMERQLLISSIAKHAMTFHPDATIVSVTADNPRHEYTYRDCFGRAAQAAQALSALGLKRADRVATLAWNDYRHMEAYYGISGAGFVCHTINPRLFPEQLVYIINHAEDRVLLVDPMFLPLIDKIRDQTPTLEHVIVMGGPDSVPEGSDAIDYETFISGHSGDYDWPEFDENTAAALCYTSGTTGNPKGVLYSHRSTVLHAMAGLQPDILDISRRDCVLPVVPLFHVNAWGIPYSCPMVGAKIVMPGPKMGDGETLYKLLSGEAVTLALGVPTVWLALLDYCETAGVRLDTLERTLVGGAAVPASMIEAFRDQHDVVLQQGWGMTEMSPLGTVNKLLPKHDDLSDDDRVRIQTKAGRGIFGVEMKIVADDGSEQPWDGEAYGALRVRGPWICSAYYRREDETGDTHDADGWFDTGDVATIDPDGFMAITDRTKDVIKSGGEWISSIDLENTAVGHPDVAEAAVIGIAHPKWTERPLMIVVPKPGVTLSRDDILGYLDGKIAKWWTPDDVVFVEELPHTATGKIKKTTLREQFSEYQLPETGS
ncbi:MAG: 3-(methylthio)propionyl-CoA ligase [Pseudomonadota bacterium]